VYDARMAPAERARRGLPWSRAGAALVLFFLAPAVGELLSSSSPPAEFFTPFGLASMSLLYGCGAILAHELCVRWQKGWVALLALGAAYGIIEEGLMLRTFFDPGWPDLGILSSYGRAWGVNWIWSFELTVFHSVYSIAVPNILVGLLFPRVAGERWTGRAWFIVICALFGIIVVLGGWLLSKYAPPLVPFLLAVAATAGFVALARFAPSGALEDPRAGTPGVRPRGAVAFFFVGLAAGVGFFASVWVVPSTGVHPIVAAAVMLAWTAGCVLAVRALSRALSFGRLNRWALSAGILGFFVLLSPIVQMDTNRKDDTRGMALVGLGMAVFLALVLVLALVRRRREGGSPAAAG
jgi:hypothetical protein